MNSIFFPNAGGDKLGKCKFSIKSGGRFELFKIGSFEGKVKYLKMICVGGCFDVGHLFRFATLIVRRWFVQTSNVLTFNVFLINAAFSFALFISLSRTVTCPILRKGFVIFFP